MSYAASRFLTVSALLSVFTAAPLFAQRDQVKRELQELASPVAAERIAATTRLVAIEGDIGADLRLAYKIAGAQEREGLLEVARLRGDASLLQQGAEALGDENEDLHAQARSYLLELPFESLQPEVDSFTPGQLATWQEFQTFRIRLDISLVLLEAHLMPGKFFGQFEELRKFDPLRVDRELLAAMNADPEFGEALDLASLRMVERAVRPERAFEPPWRKLQASAGALSPALLYQHRLEMDEEVLARIRRFERSAFHAGLEVIVNVRAAAARALAGSEPTELLQGLLMQSYESLLTQSPAPELLNLVDLEQVRTEIELTLARFGDDTLLKARIEGLRSQIDRVQQMRSNVNMRAATRPDLIAQNEIAHLMLRAGDLEGAEEEWAAAVDNAQQMLREAEGRNRTSLTSYLAAVFYNLACAQSLQFKLTKALASLKEAVSHGYKDYAWMLEDGDLDNVRVSETFRDWFQDAAPPAVADRLVVAD